MQRCSTAPASTTATECALKLKCCPNTPTRKVPRSIYEGARDMARQIAKSWEGLGLSAVAQKGRDVVCPSQTHSQARPAPTTRTERCPRRVPPGSHRPEPPEAGETDTDAELPASLKHKRDVPPTAPYERVRSNSIAAGLIQRNGSRSTYEKHRSMSAFPDADIRKRHFRHEPNGDTPNRPVPRRTAAC